MDFSIFLSHFGGLLKSIILLTFTTIICMEKRIYHFLIAVAVWLLPMIRVSGQSDVCPKPESINLTGVTRTTANLSWSLSGTQVSPVSYTMRYGIEGQQRVTLDGINAPGETFILENLEPGTTYEVDLRSSCEDSDRGWSDWSSLFRFSTLGDPVDIPLVNNFNAETGIMPKNWFTSSRFIDNVVLSANDAAFGESGQGKSVLIKATTEGIVDLITPQLNHPANDLEISFRYFATKKLKFSAGIKSNPYSSDFEPVFDHDVTEVDKWVEVRMNTSKAAASASGYCFVISVPGGLSGDLYIDDIDIHEKPQCIRMETLKCVKTDSTSLTLSWFDYEESGDYILWVNGVEKTVNGTPIADVRGVENNMRYELGNLEKNTSYKLKIRNNCTFDNGSFSEWSEPISVTTFCGTGSTVFKEDFEGANFPPQCWRQEIDGPGYWITTAVDGHGNVLTVKRESGSGVGDVIKSRLILQPVYIDKAGGYDLAFKVHRQGKVSDSNTQKIEDEGIVVWINGAPTLDGATRVEMIHDHFCLSPVEKAEGWYEYYYNINMQGTVYVIFEARDVSSSGKETHVDDIEIRKAPTCRMVENVRFESSDETSITLTWDNGRYSDATEYMVDYTISPNHAPISAPVKVSGNKYTINGLQSGGQVYTIRAKVAASCGAGNNSEYTDEVAIVEATKCSARTVLPLIEEFKSGVFPPVCWSTTLVESGEGNFEDYGGKLWSIVESKSGVTGQDNHQVAAMLESNPGARALLVMPLIDFGGTEKEYELKFTMMRGSAYAISKGDGLKIWLNDTPDLNGATVISNLISTRSDVSPSTYPDFEEGFLSSWGWDKQSVSFKASGEKYVIFEGCSDTEKVGGLHDTQLKDVRLLPKNECGIMDIAFTSVVGITTESAVVTLSDPSHATAFEAICGLSGFDPYSEGEVFVANENNLEVEITGLKPSTEYQVYVRRVCGSEKGLWSEFPHEFKSACAGFGVTVNTPFFEGFEDGYAIDKNIEDCFVQEIESGKYAAPWLAATSFKTYSDQIVEPYEGDVMAVLDRNYYGDGKTWLFYPFYFEKGKNYVASVQAYGVGAYYNIVALAWGQFAESERMTEIQKKNLYGGEWEHVKGYLSVPESGVYYIGIYGERGSGVLVDNFRVEEAYCVPPTASEVKDITPVSATIEFTSEGAVEWDIKVSIGRFTPEYEDGNVVKMERIKDKQYALTDLIANTEYSYSMRSVCEGQTSDWSPLYTFRTECQVYDVPWYDPLDNGNGLPCWEIPETTSDRYVAIDQNRNNSGYSKKGNAWKIAKTTIISPEFKDGMEGKVLSGWLYLGLGSDAVCSVGLVTEDDDLVSVANVVVKSGSVWYDFDVYFEDLAERFGEEFANASRFYISVPDATVYIDELSLKDIPLCKKPADPKIIATSPFGFTMDWTPMGEETKWEVVARRDGEEDIVFPFSSHPGIVTEGLDPVTTYDLYLRTVCNDNTYSGETYCGPYTTDCYLYSLPFDVSFDDGLMTCWENGTILPEAGLEWRAGGGQMRWQTNTSAEGSLISTIFSPAIYVKEAENLRLSFDAVVRGYVSEEDKILKVYIWSDMDGSFDDPLLVKLNERRLVAELKPADFNQNASSGKDFRTFSFDLNKMNNPDNATTFGKDIVSGSELIRIVFVASKKPGTVDFAVDNISIEDMAACLRPTGATFSEMTETSVMMQISDTTDNNQWQYVCVLSGTEVNLKDAKLRPMSVKTKDVQIKKTTAIPGGNSAQDLVGETLYDVYVRSNCGSNNYSAYRGPYSFRTACPAYSVPYKESFEDMTSFASECWGEYVANRNTWNSNPVYMIKESTYDASDGKKLLVLNYNNHRDTFCVSLPQFNRPINELKVRFDYKGSGFNVGVMMEYGNLKTLVPVEKLDDVTGYSSPMVLGKVVDFSLSDVPNLKDAAAIVFYHNSRDAANIDNVFVVPSNYNFEPTGLNVTEFNEHDASFAWNGVNGVEKYEYEVISLDGTKVKGGNITVSDKYTVDGLDFNTNYKFRLRVVEGEDPSPWSEVEFYTLAEIPALDYVSGFEDDEDNAKWVVGGSDQPNKFVFGSDADAVRSGSKSLYISNGGEGKYGYNATESSYTYVYRTLDFTPGQYTISYSWRCVGDAYNDYGRVFLAPVDEKLTFEPLFKKGGNSWQGAFRSDAGCIALDGKDDARLNRQFEFSTVTRELSFEESCRYNLVILWMNDEYNGSNPAFAIDDIEVRRVNCQTLEDLNVISVSDRDASVTFRNRNEQNTARYAVTTTGDKADAEGKWVVFNGTEAKITGLQPNTAYTVFLDAECGENEHSMAKSVTFTTLPSSVVTLPYDCSFESQDDQSWMMQTGRSINKFMYGKGASANDPDRDNMSLYITGDGGNYMYDNTKGTTVYAHKLFSLDKGLYRISYRWKANGEYKYDEWTDVYKVIDYGRVFLAPVSVVLSPGNAVFNGSVLPSGAVALDNGPMYNQKEWVEVDKTVLLKENGKYQIVVAWTNDSYSGSQPLAIDDIHFEKLPCAAVADLTALEVSKTTAEFSFENINGSPVEYSLLKNKSVVKIETIEAGLNIISLTDLEPQTKYELAVQAICDDDKKSDVVTIGFETECEPIAVTLDNPYIDDFESYADTRSLSSCWTEDYIKGNLSYAKDSWEVNTFETSSKRSPRSPRTNLTLRGARRSTMTREFRLEGGKYYEISVWAVQSRASTASISMVLVSEDFSETRELSRHDEVNYLTYSKVAGYFRPDESGVYRLGIRGKGGQSVDADWLVIDDMEVRELGVEAPLNLQVDDITRVSARVSWAANADKYELELWSRGVKVGESVQNITDTEFGLSDLTGATNYEVKVRAVNADKTSEWASVRFTTECSETVLPYAVDFNDEMTGDVPPCWTNANGWLTDEKFNWGVTADRNNKYMSLPASSAYGKAVLETPVLTGIVTGQKMSFRYRNNTVGEQLQVAVSLDGGVTYSETIATLGRSENWTIQRFSLDTYVGKDIVVAFMANPKADNLGHSIDIDDVRFNCHDDDKIISAIVCEGNDYNDEYFNIRRTELVPGRINTFEHLIEGDFDNPDAQTMCDRYVKLELMVNSSTLTIIDYTMCEGDVYQEAPFDDKPYTTQGVYRKPYIQQNGCDSIIQLNLTVLPKVKVLNVEVCEGDVYEFNGKSYPVGSYEIPDVHKIEEGRECDYVTELTVSARPKYFEYHAYFCEGSKYTWPVNREEYTVAGVYEERLITPDGCDSICRLNLEMLPAATSFDMTICSGGQYIWGEGSAAEVFTKPGRYVKAFKNVLGCDSTVTLFLSVNPPIERDIDDYVCEGHPYEAYGLSIPVITKDTIVIQKSQTDELCDSTTRIHIEFIPTIRVDSLYELSDGESVVFNGNTINEPGTYNATFRTSLGCDSVVILSVTNGRGVDNVYALPLLIAPNPVRGGESTFVDRTWTAEERKGLTVEILNSVGQIVRSEQPMIYPIEIRTLNVSGIYYIRILSGTGELYVGKLIVK